METDARPRRLDWLTPAELAPGRRDLDWQDFEAGLGQDLAGISGLSVAEANELFI